MNVFVRKNLYVLYDSIFGFSESKSGVFYSFEKTNIISTESQKYKFARIDFKLDYQTDHYQRNVKNIIDSFGILGGNYEILRILFGLILGVYTNKMFSYEVANRCKVEETDRGDQEHDENKSNNQRLHNSCSLMRSKLCIPEPAYSRSPSNYNNHKIQNQLNLRFSKSNKSQNLMIKPKSIDL